MVLYIEEGKMKVRHVKRQMNMDWEMQKSPFFMLFRVLL